MDHEQEREWSGAIGKSKLGEVLRITAVSDTVSERRRKPRQNVSQACSALQFLIELSKTTLGTVEKSIPLCRDAEVCPGQGDNYWLECLALVYDSGQALHQEQENNHSHG